MSNPLLKNQAFYNESGFIRRIALGKSGKVRPVMRADKRPADDNRAGTYQQVYDGDIIIQYSKKSDTLSFLTAVIQEDEVRNQPLPERFDFKPIISTIDILMIQWLEEDTTKPWLPPGLGWDGKHSQTDVLKITSAIKRLPDDIPFNILKRISDAIYFTPNERVHVGTQYISSSATALKEVMGEIKNEAIVIKWQDVDGITSKVHIEEHDFNEEFAIFQDTTHFCVIEFIPLKTDEQLRWKFFKLIW